MSRYKIPDNMSLQERLLINHVLYKSVGSKEIKEPKSKSVNTTAIRFFCWMREHGFSRTNTVSEMSNRIAKLSPEQRKFVVEFLIDKNPTCIKHPLYAYPVLIQEFLPEKYESVFVRGQVNGELDTKIARLFEELFKRRQKSVKRNHGGNYYQSPWITLVSHWGSFSPEQHKVIQEIQWIAAIGNEKYAQDFLGYGKAEGLIKLYSEIKTYNAMKVFERTAKLFPEYISDRLIINMINSETNNCSPQLLSELLDLGGSHLQSKSAILEAAIKSGRKDILELLLNRGEFSTLLTEDANLTYTLMNAALDRGRSYQTWNSLGETVPRPEAVKEAKEVIALLLKKTTKSSLNIKDEETKFFLMYRAIQLNDTNLIKQLFVHCGEFPLDKIVFKGYSPLIFDAIYKNPAIAKFFLEQQPNLNINCRDDKGFSPLMLAADIKSVEAFTFFFERGADRDLFSNDAQTVTDIARERKFGQALEMMTKADKELTFAEYDVL